MTTHIAQTIHPLTCGDWKFWIAEDGAVCIEGPDGDGTAMRWEKFKDIYEQLEFQRG